MSLAAVFPPARHKAKLRRRLSSEADLASPTPGIYRLPVTMRYRGLVTDSLASACRTG